jgi:hypothetical protein
LKLVVDDCERHADSNFNQLYSSLRQDHMTKLAPQLPAGTSVRLPPPVPVPPPGGNLLQRHFKAP